MSPNASSAIRVLLVDADIHRANSLRAVLLAAGIAEVRHISGGVSLADEVSAFAPDVIIVDMGLPDRDTLEGLRRASIATPTPIVMFADENDPAFVEEAIAAGVSSYNFGNVGAGAIRPILTAAIALFRRYQELESERDATNASLQERRIIEKAKAILVRERRMTEAQAYRWLRKKAMNESRKLAGVAAELVARNVAQPGDPE